MPKKTVPTFVQPMMAKIAEEPFDSPDWIFELKLDGYRGIAVFDAAGKPHLWSRNGLPLEKKFPTVAKALSNLKLRRRSWTAKWSPLTKRESPAFTSFSAFRNNRQHRLSTTFSMSCGAMAKIYRTSQSWSADGFWNASLSPKLASR